MNHGNNNTRPLTSKGEMQDLDPRFQQVVRASSAGETIGHEKGRGFSGTGLAGR